MEGNPSGWQCDPAEGDLPIVRHGGSTAPYNTSASGKEIKFTFWKLSSSCALGFSSQKLGCPANAEELES
jgi:hypothetical protein